MYTPRFIGFLVLSALSAVTSVFLAGCSQDGDKTVDGKADVAERVVKTYSELAPSDVIVRVNQAVLTKSDVEKEVAKFKITLQRESGMDRGVMAREVQWFRKNTVENFVNQNLLADEALLSAKLIDDATLTNEIEKLITESAAHKKVSREVFLKSADGNEQTVWNLARLRILRDLYISKRIFPQVELTPEMVSNYMASVRRENSDVNTLNAQKTAKLEQIRTDTLAGTIVFTNVAATVSDEAWDLGEMERDDFETEKVRDAVFSLPEGGVTKVIADDENLRVYQVAKIVPAVRDEDGLLTEPERRLVYQIQLPKDLNLVEDSYEDSYEFLLSQMMDRKILETAEVLKTNGFHHVVWPCGENLWQETK